jgi:hypothetical protein
MHETSLLRFSYVRFWKNLTRTLSLAMRLKIVLAAVHLDCARSAKKRGFVIGPPWRSRHWWNSWKAEAVSKLIPSARATRAAFRSAGRRAAGPKEAGA